MITEKEIKKRIKGTKPVCAICKGKGWYFVNEWIGPLQGRKDCKCKK